MPREGVPYPERLLCSLRCELKNIWNALSGKLHSVNGVEGDGQGNVDIVSGDAAVVVTPQPLSNQVEISLDQSQLPAAAVSSVNGATGAVVLDGSDIEGVTPGQTVNQEITALTGAISGLGGLISAETTNRQNADSALQTNINAANAAISLKVGGSGNIGSDTKPVKIVNGDAVAVTDALMTSADVAAAITANNQYCILTTGTQQKTGQLISLTEGGYVVSRSADYSIGFIQKNTGVDRASTTDIRRLIPLWIVDANDNQMFSLRYEKIGTTHRVYVRVIDTQGVQHDQMIMNFTE